MSYGDELRRKKWLARAPSPGTFLCKEADIALPGAKGFTFGEGMERFDMFIVKTDKGLFAYVNACPHAFTTLETFTDRFLTRAKDKILCTTHGALFDLEDGFCTSGPCAGKNLVPLSLSIDGDEIRLGAQTI
jgi:naringenin degradation protein FdeD